MKEYTKVLTIAGSDSGGGAGIQADLKTFQANGCYGMSVITAVTAQNTLGVTDIHPIPVETIRKQLFAVLDDIGTDAVKIGMLHSVEVIECVADGLSTFSASPVVLDPVMVATSGDRLIEDDAVDAMKSRLFPQVKLITPNIPETEVLIGEKVHTIDQMKEAAKSLAEKYGVGVLVKGGHLSEKALEDIFCDGKNIYTYKNQRLVTKNSHGTGCTLSSAIASQLARGYEMTEAIERGIKYLQGAIKAGAEYATGGGSGPVHHSFNI